MSAYFLHANTVKSHYNSLIAKYNKCFTERFYNNTAPVEPIKQCTHQTKYAFEASILGLM